jgi:hypothetical protein
LRPHRRSIDVHARGDSNEQPGRQVPAHNRSRQSNNISYPLREVQKQEQIP